MLFLALKTYGAVSNKNNLVCVKITWSLSYVGVTLWRIKFNIWPWTSFHSTAYRSFEGTERIQILLQLFQFS